MTAFRFLLIPLSLLMVNHVAMAQASDPLATAAWLAGCWSPENEEAGSVEVWLAPAGATMPGVHRTVKEGKTVSNEFMIIHANEQGALVFTALIAGQAATDFVALPAAEDELVFENLQHDFPQRVIYRSVPPDRLAARIEGVEAGAVHGIDFPMRRTACETP